MSAVMSDAESKFFSSRGAEVDPSLTSTEPPPSESEPGNTPPETPAAVAPPAKTAEPAKVVEPPAKPTEPVKAAEPPKPAEKAPEAAKPAGAPEGFVPQQALHTERQKRQQLEEQNRQLQAQMQQFQQLLQGGPPAAEQPPDPVQDPYGALQYQLQQQARQIEQANQWREQQEQSQRQQQGLAAFTQRVAASEQAFRSTHPDYDAAATHAIQQYDRMLSASIPDPMQRQQQIRIEAGNALARAVANGQDPAEFVYQFAKNMGYAPAAPAPAAPAAVPPAAAVADVAQTLERGMKQQAKGGGGAPATGGEMTPEQLAAINDPKAFN
ncbi:MAG: hypothetical protein ACRD3F_15195, partial [Acidobacteriaceae bacterium]